MNKRTRRHIHINPVDYDYMDNMPLEGWVWEITRRTKDYLHNADIISKINPDIPIDQDSEFSGIVLKDLLYGSHIYFANPVNNFINPKTHFTVKMEYFYMDDKKQKYLKKMIEPMGIPKPEVKYCDFQPDSKPAFRGINPIRIHSYQEIATSGCKDCFQVLEWLSPIGFPMDTVYIGFSKSAKKKDIEKYLTENIKKYLKPAKTKLRTDDKWKWYLIVYDLKNKYSYLTYQEISERLIEAYPFIRLKKTQAQINSYELFRENNCEHYHKEALRLINGGYKKYFFKNIME